MRYTSASGTTDGSECFVTLNIVLGILRVPRNSDSTKFVVGPDTSQASTHRAITTCGRLRDWRQFDRYGTTVATT